MEKKSWNGLGWTLQITQQADVKVGPKCSWASFRFWNDADGGPVSARGIICPWDLGKCSSIIPIKPGVGIFGHFTAPSPGSSCAPSPAPGAFPWINSKTPIFVRTDSKKVGINLSIPRGTDPCLQPHDLSRILRHSIFWEQDLGFEPLHP